MFKKRYLAMFALAPALSQCQPACAPTPGPVETTTTVAETTTTAATTTTTVAAAPYTFSLSCTPLAGTFRAGSRDIVIQGGFGAGGTPQTVVPAGTSVTLPWLSSLGEVYSPIPEVTFDIVDPVTFAQIDERHLVLAEECPAGWTSPVDSSAAPLVSFVGFDCDNLQQPNTQPILLFIGIHRAAPAAGWTVSNDQDTWAWEDLMTEADPEGAWVPWARIGDVYANTFQPSTVLTVRDANDAVVFQDEFTVEDVSGHLCAPALNGGILVGA